MKTNLNGFSAEVDSLKIALNPQTKGNFVNVFVNTSNYLGLMQESMVGISIKTALLNREIQQAYNKLECEIFGSNSTSFEKMPAKEIWQLKNNIMSLHNNIIAELNESNINFISFQGAYCPISEAIRFHQSLYSYLERVDIAI